MFPRCLFMLVLAVFPFFAHSGPYQFDLKNELVFVGVSTGLGLVGLWRDSEKDDPTGADLNNLNKQDLWGIDRHYAGRWDPDAHQNSNAVLAAAILSPGLMLFKQGREIKTIGLLYSETQLAILAGISLSKGIVTRYRPFTYGTDAPIDERLDADATRSFFSGHSAIITGNLVFSAKLYSDYYPDSNYKPWVWAGTLALAAYGSWQRVEAGRHFPTDVITGMSYGAFMAYWIPQRHKQPRRLRKSHWLPYVWGEEIGFTWRKAF